MEKIFNVSFPNLGLHMTFDNVALSFGTIKIYWYAVLIATGMLIAMIFAGFLIKRYNIKEDSFYNCVIVGIITAIIGARLYFVAFKWDYYSQDPIQILYINQGGLAIYGGIIGALLGGGITAKIQKLNLPAILDITALGFLIGQGFGRWGNFMNQEAFGSEVPDNYLLAMVSEGTGGKLVHPCFLYESIWCFLGFFVLYYISRKKQKYYGQIFVLYIIWYGFERMIVEGLRTDSLYLPFKIFNQDIRVSQLIAATTMIMGIVILIINRKKQNFDALVKTKVKPNNQN